MIPVIRVWNEEECYNYAPPPLTFLILSFVYFLILALFVVESDAL